MCEFNSSSKNTEAEARTSKLCWSYINRFMEISAFREFCKVSFQLAESTHKNIQLSTANKLFYSDAYDKYFKDKEAVLKMIETPESMAQMFYEQKYKKVKDSIDAASLVFAHAIIDNLIYELCSITSRILPDKWALKLTKKKVEFEELQRLSFDDIRDRLIDKYIESLEREALLEKYDTFLSVCNPPNNHQLTNGVKLDRSRLDRLDRLRHDAAHGNRVSSFLPCGDNDIIFIRDMCTLLVSNVCENCNIKINPAFIDFRAPN